MIDLRSDTVTRPSPAMRGAMAEAEVGDDVYGEDPTVRRLELETSALLGKEDGLFVTSGTQGNQCALLALTQSGDEVWAHESAHVVDGEQGGIAVLGRCQVRTFRGAGGLLDPAELRLWLRDPRDFHYVRPRVVCLENTVAITGGVPLPAGYQEAIASFAHAHGLTVHLDGARLWDAMAATGADAAMLATGADTVSVCFSKSLGAPVGSLVAGSAELVERARRARKLLGGGMRQAGIVAAGAVYALSHNLTRLPEVQARARRLAEAIGSLQRIRCDPEEVATSMVLGWTAPGGAEALAAELTAAGVGCLPFGDDVIRMVLHLDISDEDVERAASIIHRVAGSSRIGDFGRKTSGGGGTGNSSTTSREERSAI
jgi:threonine aldolase